MEYECDGNTLTDIAGYLGSVEWPTSKEAAVLCQRQPQTVITATLHHTALRDTIRHRDTLHTTPSSPQPDPHPTMTMTPR